MAMYNPDYYWWQEIRKRDDKILSLTDELAHTKYLLKLANLKLENINHPLKK
tara:strand:+ start:298 stop:453 length:156 start_codon:yes stop_codon:yes gene_type:complete